MTEWTQWTIRQKLNALRVICWHHGVKRGKQTQVPTRGDVIAWAVDPHAKPTWERVHSDDKALAAPRYLSHTQKKFMRVRVVVGQEWVRTEHPALWHAWVLAVLHDYTFRHDYITTLH